MSRRPFSLGDADYAPFRAAALQRLRQRRGNCYAAAEALYHILGGKRAGWTPVCLALGPGRDDRTEHHWFLRHKSGLVLDPSRRQFRAKGWWRQPDYSKGRGTGFLTKRPSKRARVLIEQLTWQATQTNPRGIPRGRRA